MSNKWNKWFPNSTGRDMPMTSRFGIEHNKATEYLRLQPVKTHVGIEHGLEAPKRRKPLGYLWGTSFHSSAQRPTHHIDPA